jgi:hypothetical protein
MSPSETVPAAPRTLDIRTCSLASERRRKFAKFHGTRALIFVLAVDDPLANTFLLRDGGKTMGILQLVVSRFIDLIVRLILSTRVRTSAHCRFCFSEDTSDSIAFETVPAVSQKVALCIIARQRPELGRVHQIQHFTLCGIIEGADSCS